MQQRDVRFESAQLQLNFFTTEITAYTAAAKAAAAHYASVNVDLGRRYQALAEVGYTTLRRFLADPLHAGLLDDATRTELDSRMRAFQEQLQTLAPLAAQAA